MSLLETLVTEVEAVTPTANRDPDQPVLMKFERLAYDAGLVVPFDWGSWQDEAARLTNDPQALSRAALPTLQKLITTHIRKERFCEGHLNAILASGHLLALLKRLQQLHKGDD